MKKVSLVLMAFTLLVFWSCEKGIEQPTVFPKYFVWTGVKPKGKIRLFYDKKEITDQVEIDRVLNDTSKHFGESFKALNVYLTIPVPQIKDTVLTFTHPDTVRFRNSVYTSLLKDHMFTFTSGDRVLYNMSTGEIDPFSFQKHKPVQGPALPLITGYTHSAQLVHVAYGDYNSMELPVMGSVFKRFVKNSLGTSGYINSMRGVFNEFDEGYILKMQKGDTLLIQEYLYELKAK
ncbi:hypothetical protein [Siphonobacter sp. SORGH_AS_1065]|uniref:hypothetical protein n=1 Tax=Siphonobacter sp. SORGH_AS_1065 TaxID=3041795 RepID=UPI002781D465|nr:hypothetical protein [Siphonobacter sp. SORGH_AS_1065]MDQ1089139.1 hypothetical protein [Siphonobacter sp. SORGH_AS_1065]